MRGHRALLDGAMVAAMVISVLGLLFVPAMVALIPSDYFAREEAPPLPWAESHPVLRLSLHVLKNLVGAVLVLAGIAMLVLPGQGVLTMIIGVMCLDFPGKRRLELAVVRRRGVLRLVNWLRARTGHTPLQVVPRQPRGAPHGKGSS